jgi:ethanolamine ammonia-lyase small subunit
MPETSPTPAPERNPADANDPVLHAVRARTPARLLVGRSGPAYRTTTWLQLRQDHAIARDAVRAEVDLDRDLGAEFVAHWKLFEVCTLAATKDQYLLRPDLGRHLALAGRAAVQENCPRGADVQVVIGDGLSAAAVRAQVPVLLPLLVEELRREGMGVGRPFFVRHCRVGILNDVGDLLDPAVVVLLVGERPGLACAESLSAYLAYRPRPGDSDARRNLISNIHARGVPTSQAAYRIAALCQRLQLARQSGVAIKEQLPATALADQFPAPRILQP